MIVFGSRAVELATTPLPNTCCPSCDTQGSLLLGVFRKHAHVFWIPMFPMGKTGVSQCQHCQHVMQASQMTGPVASQYQRLAENTQGPAWQWVGLFLVLILVGAGALLDARDKSNTAEYLAAPRAGDVYRFKQDNGNYSTFRIESVVGDSLFINPNEYEVTRSTGFHEILDEENYADFTVGMVAEDLSLFYADEDLISITRK